METTEINRQRRSLLRNPIENRLRAGWRLILQGVLFLVGSFVAQFLVGVGAGILLVMSGGNVNDPQVTMAFVNLPPVRLLLALLSLAAIVASCVFAARRLDKRPFRNFGFHFNRRWWADLAFGLFLGAFLMLFIFIIERSAGWVTASSLPLDSSALLGILAYLGVYVCVAVTEELLSRGYQTRNLAEGLGFLRINPRWAVLLAYLGTSIFFGALHASNPNATLTSTLNLMVAGLFLGLGYILTGELALPIGLHLTWNFFQGNVFGFPVSGMASTASFLQIEQGGPALWTGAAFGPEAGLMGMAAILLGMVLILGWVRLTRGAVAIDERIGRYL